VSKEKVERKFEVLVPIHLNKTGVFVLPAHANNGIKGYVVESQLSTGVVGMRWLVKMRYLKQVGGESLDLTIVDKQPVKTG